MSDGTAITAATETVATPDGGMATYLARPATAITGGLVLLFMGGGGMREEFRAIARRIAAHGHLVAAPDLYHRTPSWQPEGADMDAIRRQMASVSRAMVGADVDALLDHLDATRGTRDLALGCVGFCWGGQFPLWMAGRRPDRVRAAVSLYGTELVDGLEDSPHRLIPQVSAEVVLLFAERDGWVPEENPPLLERLLTEHGVPHHVEVLPGTEHGFLFTDSPAHHPAAAAAAWARLLDTFERRLHRA